jgi:hypothetical protein
MKLETYTLVNPAVHGSFNKFTKSDDDLKAAKVIYARLAENFMNSCPVFFFSLRGGDKKYYHYRVTEMKTGNKVDYSISLAELRDEKAGLQIIKDMEKTVSEQAPIHGGAKGDDDAFDDDDDDDDFTRDGYGSKKIVYLSYYPYAYYWYGPYYWPSFYPYIYTTLPSWPPGTWGKPKP